MKLLPVFISPISRYMIELGQHECDYLDICRNFRQVYDTPCIQEDADQKVDTLKNIVLYIILFIEGHSLFKDVDI